MATRTGMTALIKRLRLLTNAEVGEFTLNGTEYWSDEHLQDVLDANVIRYQALPIVWDNPTVTLAGVEPYTVAKLPDLNFEAPDSTGRFVIRSAEGIINEADYTYSEKTGEIIFTTPPSDTTLYLSVYRYNVDAAAADIWEKRLVQFSAWYDFAWQKHEFTRSQAFQHAKDMQDRAQRRGEDYESSITGSTPDVSIGVWFRTDVNSS